MENKTGHNGGITISTNNHKRNARIHLLDHLFRQDVWRQTELVAQVTKEIGNGPRVGIALSRLRHTGVVEKVDNGDRFVHLRLGPAVRELQELGLLKRPNLD